MHLLEWQDCLSLNCVSPRLLALKTLRFFSIPYYSQRTKAEPRGFPAHWRSEVAQHRVHSNAHRQAR